MLAGKRLGHRSESRQAIAQRARLAAISQSQMDRDRPRRGANCACQSFLMTTVDIYIDGHDW